MHSVEENKYEVYVRRYYIGVTKLKFDVKLYPHKGAWITSGQLGANYVNVRVYIIF